VILRKCVPGLSEPALRQFTLQASRALRLHGMVNILVTTSSDLRALNRRFLGKDRPTDVLSFPPALVPESGFAGDIAISADIAAQNARRLGHPVAQEIKILVLHGLLHLAGYDHERDHGQMQRKEESLRRALGLPAGLIARNGTDAMKARSPSKGIGGSSKTSRGRRKR